MTSFLIRFFTADSKWAPVLFFILGCSSPTATHSRDTTPTDDTAAVTAAADRDVAAFLNKIPSGHERDYGFSDRAEFDDVEIGLPLRVHTIDIDRSGTTPRAVRKIRPLDQWRVPLIANGYRRALLTVVKEANRFVTVDFGASDLAAALDTLDAEIDGADGATPYLVRIFALRQDFVGVKGREKNATDVFYPAFPNFRTSGKAPLSAVAPTPTIPNSPRSREALFSLVDEQIGGGSR